MLLGRPVFILEFWQSFNCRSDVQLAGDYVCDQPGAVFLHQFYLSAGVGDSLLYGRCGLRPMYSTMAFCSVHGGECNRKAVQFLFGEVRDGCLVVDGVNPAAGSHGFHNQGK